MKILFLGSSSFTGLHFVNKLSKKNSNKIFCTFTKKKSDYKSIRKKRIKILEKKSNIKLIYNTSFGDKKFISLIKKNKFNIICLHHAETSNYNDDKKFKFKKSIKKNTHNINKVFENISVKSLIIISNTIFQEIKSKKYFSVNNYGKSKSITYEILKNACKNYNFKYKSIFITNPWGPYEDEKLNYYLITSWVQNKKTFISHPNYVRDNIYIDKLSNAYHAIINSKSKKIEYFPSGYCSTNKKYINSLKIKFEKFFNKKANVVFAKKANYIQPLVRINGKRIRKNFFIKENLNNYFLNYKKLMFKKS